MPAPLNNLAVFFEYLDGLRKSGETNMFGASPYLESVFDIDGREARVVLSKWMETFDPEKTPTERAAAA